MTDPDRMMVSYVDLRNAAFFQSENEPNNALTHSCLPADGFVEL
jgi:hypothetical protein